MNKKKNQTPEYQIVLVRRDPWKYLRSGSFVVFRILLVGLAVGILVYNQYALSSAVKAVDDLKRDLLLNQAEYPIEKTLEGKTQGKLSKLDRIRIAKLISQHEACGIDPSFTLDLIRRESSFDPRAVSPTGALGLMQLLPSTAEWLAEKEGLTWRGKEMLLDPVTNVQFGLAYLRYLSADFRGERFLRAAYQAGPNRVRKTMGEGGYYAVNP